MKRRHLPFALAAVLPTPALLSSALLMSARTLHAQNLPAGSRQWFIFLESGRQTPDDKAAVAAMQRGHIENFKRLFAAGQLFAAGPLRDPGGSKRGIVTVQARTRDELMGYFQPDEYVREGYMTVNAQPAIAHRPLNTEGIDASRVEEVRIVLIARGTEAPDATTEQARRRWLQDLVAHGTAQAWYTLETGAVAEVLFAQGTDTAALEAAFVAYPGRGRGGAEVAVWRQWISPGVVR